ncbi:small integral membrane protein 22 isoform X1 [Camelus ferus]|uniref:Small integral membrane protein 22 isoform X1 n=1 Tax=Camelus ferus TaxID=419612 RepID=A0A8B8RE00_CAMFR|nr:small integral membrane protein 22 isoform X1 [Camelus ferus]
MRIRKQEVVCAPRTQDRSGWGSPEAGGTQDLPAEMALSTEDLKQELNATVQQVLGKLRSGQLFQSKWDTAAFLIFLIFLGIVLLLLLLVCFHCCCPDCCQHHSPRSQKKNSRGFDNLALEP